MILKIKSIPKLSWSSKSPTNFKPSLKTLSYLCLGLIFFGFGEGLLIVSGIGASPWNVLHQGIAFNLDLSIGTVAFFVSFLVLLFWRFLNLKIGLGTVLNFIIIAIMIDVTIYFLDQPNEFFTQLFMVIIGVLLVGFGSSLYLIANLGAGPRDGLMTGLQKKTNAPIALVRFCIELFVVLCGWFLGGVFGVGTIVYAIGVGPAVALGISNFKR
ncbi:YitT family protein [Pelagibacteraceae bacterium]|jgi:uncharacterized membrane protein YczE|nr:YitT family protein [Pelagibacteraceae bacterium]